MVNLMMTEGQYDIIARIITLNRGYLNPPVTLIR